MVEMRNDGEASKGQNTKCFACYVKSGVSTEGNREAVRVYKRQWHDQIYIYIY